MTIEYIARLEDNDGALLAETMASRDAHVNTIFQSMFFQFFFDSVNNGLALRCLAPGPTAQGKCCPNVFPGLAKSIAFIFQVTDDIEPSHG
jgi:hypothetical protein